MQSGKRYEFAMVAIMFFTWGSVFLDRMAQLYLAPYFAPALGLSVEQIGVLASGLALMWALSSYLLGTISDRVGRKPILIPMVFVFSALSWLSGFANNFWQMLFIRGGVGLAEGPCWSVLNAVVERSSAPERRGRNIGMVASAGALIGLGLAPVLTTQVAAHFGWRIAFFIAGIPGLIMGWLIWRFIREPMEAEDSVQAKRAADWRQLFRYRNIWLCALANIGLLTWITLQGVFAPLYITSILRKSGTEVGVLLGASGAGSFIFGLLMMFLSDKVGRKPIWLVAAFLSIFLTLAIWWRPLYSFPWILSGVVAVTNGSLVLSSLVMVLIPTESVPGMHAAGAIGFATLVGEIGGSVLAPAIAGALARAYGLQIPLFIAAGGMALTLLLGLFITETRAGKAKGLA